MFNALKVEKVFITSSELLKWAWYEDRVLEIVYKILSIFEHKGIKLLEGTVLMEISWLMNILSVIF